MKRTIIIASSALVALAACDEREAVERERVAEQRELEPMERDPYERPGPLDEGLGEEPREPIGERRTAPEQGKEMKEEQAERKPVGGVTGGEAEKQPTAGQTGALGHMPKDCKAVTHADVSQLTKLPGAKQHLIPAFQEAQKQNPNVNQMFSLLKDGGIDSTKDIDSIALCIKDMPTPAQAQSGQDKMRANTNVIVIMTGDFPKGELVPALLKRGGAQAEKIEIDGAEVFRDKGKDIFIGQAEDGTVIAAASRDAFSGALSGGGDYTLSAQNAFGILLPAETMKNLIERYGDATTKKLASDVERTTLTFDAGKNELSFRIDMPDHTQAAELGGVFKAIKEQWKQNPPTGQIEKLLADGLEDANIAYDDDVLRLTVKVGDQQVEQTMKNLGDQVRTEFR